MADNVINMGKATENSMLITPEQCLKDCLENDLGKRGAFKDGKKILIIALDDTEGRYSFSFSQAGLKVSEIIGLLSILKKYFINLMGF
jgi:hypothetical protein